MLRHNILSYMPTRNVEYQEQLKYVTTTLTNAKNVSLTTHRNSDGDGIGSVVALYWSLRQLGLSCTFIHVDPIPQRYHFLLTNVDTKLCPKNWTPEADSVLVILDTNQGSLCDPLYSHYKAQNKKVIFVDHHVAQTNLDESDFHLIYTAASSTGEVIHDVIRELKIEITDEIATAIYTSLTFDTQAFKLLKNSVRSHQIAAELASKNIRTDFIQRELFATWTVAKLFFLSDLINTAVFLQNNQVAYFVVKQTTLQKHNLTIDDISDVIDLFTLVKSIKLCYALIESSTELYKLSIRSINSDGAYRIAQKMGGGGHAGSAGAWIQGPIENTLASVNAIVSHMDL